MIFPTVMLDHVLSGNSGNMYILTYVSTNLVHVNFNVNVVPVFYFPSIPVLTHITYIHKRCAYKKT